MPIKWTNYHQHCYFCDGSDAPEAYITAAIEQNVGSFGFSSHAPVPFRVPWCVPQSRLNEYFERITTLKKEYTHKLPIFLGLEIDFIPQVISPKDPKFAVLDYCVGSVHLIQPDNYPTPENHFYLEIDGAHKNFLHGFEQLFDNNIQHAVETYFERTRQMVTTAPPNIVGHIDKIKINNPKNKFFNPTENWYTTAVTKTLELIKKEGVMIEINTRGIYKKKCTDTYPSTAILEQIHALQIPIVLNSDAHAPHEITAEFIQTAKLLHNIGFTHLHILTENNTWQPRPFSAQGIEI